ncbi:HNH endonuclease, partial [Bacteroides phage PhiCrAssBcn18]
MEEWRDIEGYEGLYKVSSLGRIMSVGRTFRTGKNGTRLCVLPDSIKKTVVNNKGYLRVSLNKDGKLLSFLVHRLVAQAFIP